MAIRHLSAKDLMQKDVVTVSETTSILKAAKLMREASVSSLVIEPENKNDAFAIITRKDIVEAMMTLSLTDIPTTVADHMSKPAITTGPDLGIELCYQMMKMIGIRRMPVVEGGTLLGILSNSDLYSALIDELG